MDHLTLFGLVAVAAMLVSYAFEQRSPWFILAFALSCGLGSIYGFLQGAWPFGLVEAIWAFVAFRRWWPRRRQQLKETTLMIDHVSVPVRDLAAAAVFYEAVFAPLGLVKLVTREGTIGFGKRYPEFWLNQRNDVPQTHNPGGHICLRARTEAAVRAFHAAALENGGFDDGPPGQRAAAMTTYFGAFILDRDGNKLEAASFPRPDEG